MGVDALLRQQCFVRAFFDGSQADAANSWSALPPAAKAWVAG